MNVFDTHAKIVGDYARYIRSFINIADPAIQQTVDAALAQGTLWPEPLLQFNPAYDMAGSVAQIAKNETLHSAIADIFKGYSLYRHQLEAIKLGISGQDFVVTSGTGSGKSLTYIGSIFHRLLTSPQSSGVTAIVVYPMNALINSQTNEFRIYKENYERATGTSFPITFGQYTGQEREEVRDKLREHPPHVLPTNYMMLELLFTRVRERPIRDAIYGNLRYLVFDELHTYRGRQGADVAMLIRRVAAQCKQQVTCIGTSATMVSVGSLASQREQVAQVATTVFGRPFRPEQVVTETLARSLEYSGALPSRPALAEAIGAGIDPGHDAAKLRTHPVAVWLENRVAQRSTFRRVTASGSESTLSRPTLGDSAHRNGESKAGGVPLGPLRHERHKILNHEPPRTVAFRWGHPVRRVRRRAADQLADGQRTAELVAALAALAEPLHLDLGASE
jgi:hypothetical protein